MSRPFSLNKEALSTTKHTRQDRIRSIRPYNPAGIMIEIVYITTSLSFLYSTRVNYTRNKITAADTNISKIGNWKRKRRKTYYIELIKIYFGL